MLVRDTHGPIRRMLTSPDGSIWQSLPFPAELQYPDGRLNAYPEVEELWFSPDGTSWDGRRVADVFGDGS